MTIVFSSIPTEHREPLRLALAAAGLPTDDLDQPGRQFFELSDVEGPMGYVGIQGEAPDRLLRSLVVLPGRTRSGYGGLLVAHAEVVALREGAERLHLLTTTAGDYFRARGYGDADRAAAPPAIRSTAQFSSLCPASATYLVKELE